MNSSDRWFRFSLNFFIFLMFFQLGSLLVLRSSYKQAQNYVKDNQAHVDFQCGDFHKDENYWDLSKNQPELLSSCMDLDCPQSLYKGPEIKGQEVDLHVLSVERPWPYRWEGMNLKKGNFVDVKVAQSEKPLKLVLVSQSFMLWDLDLEVGHSTMKPVLEKEWAPEDLSLHSFSAMVNPENWNISYPRKIDEIIVVAPDLVWIEGLEPSTKVTYFDQKQLCTYPTAWEEIENPENQFRRLTLALKEYTELDVTSFQGREIGRKFKVPFRNLLAESRQGEVVVPRDLASQVDSEMGLQWQRQGDQLKAVAYKYKRDGQIHRLKVPAQTSQAFFEMANGVFYLIHKHQFGTWDKEKSKFEPLQLPLRMPAMYWPAAMTFNPLKSEILIYNDDRGGEVYAYNVVTSSWRIFAQRVGYSLMAIHYDTQARKLIGARYHGKQITELVSIREGDLRLEAHPLEKPLDFSKRRWHADLTPKGSHLWLKIHHPAQPQGHLHPLKGS